MNSKAEIKMLVMDVDGTLTDGKIYMSAEGESMKAFSIKDGYGIHDILIPHGIRPVIITGRKSKILENRCIELGISELHQGVSDKLKVLEKIMSEYGVVYSEVAYIGDDLNDLPCMIQVKEKNGIVACPADAVAPIKNVADYVSGQNGGDGAVRDFIDHIISL